jgi:hypothetical protein
MPAALNTAMAIANVCILFGMARLVGYLAGCWLQLIFHLSSSEDKHVWSDRLMCHADSRFSAFIRATTIAALIWVMATILLWIVVAITSPAALERSMRLSEIAPEIPPEIQRPPPPLPAQD